MTGLRARSASMRHAEQAGPNMTPMVDVTLVILIFFMAAAGLATPELLLRVGLAEPTSATDTASENVFALPSVELVIELDASDGAVRATGLGLNGATLAAFEDAIGRVAPTLPSDASIVIEPSDRTPYAAVVAVRDRLESAGVSRVGLR